MAESDHSLVDEAVKAVDRLVPMAAAVREQLRELSGGDGGSDDE